MLTWGRKAPAVGDGKGLLALSIVGSFSRLPWLEYAAGSVVRPACHLALVAVRAPLAALHGDAQNDSRRATTRGGPRGVETAVLWPRYVLRELRRHGGPSDSPAR